VIRKKSHLNTELWILSARGWRPPPRYRTG
jgi:hypothetical protein